MYLCNSCNSFFEEPTVEGGCSERLGYEVAEYCSHCNSVDFRKVTSNGERLVINREMLDTNVDLLNQVGKITMTDYQSDPEASMEDMLASALEDLLRYYDDLSDEFEGFKQNVEENYTRPSRKEEIGYNMNW